MDAYQRVKILGRGSYGSAILVRERKGGQQRVIKEIDLSRMPAAAAKEAQSEAGVLRSLSHPYIVGYFDTFVEATKLYIVMEFADGGDLAASIKEQKALGRNFAESEALRTFAQCCLALRHVHSRHILHRDLKSGNIFLTKTGTVKLGDFGIAKVLDTTNAEAQTLIGTPIYLAPEVCDSRPYGIKADIWSIGVVMYELLALAQPFRADNLAALMMRILRDEPDPLSQDLYSQEVRGVVSWMLQKRPDKRPTVEEILAVPAVDTVATQLSPNGSAAGPKAKPNSAREPSVGKRPRSGASERGDRQQPPVAPPAAVGKQPSRDALDDFLGNKRAVEAAKMRAQGGAAAQYLPGSHLAGSEPSSSSGARHRAPSVGDNASEYWRNRELAAQAKARAEGDHSERRRCHSLDPTMGAAQARRDGVDAKRASEEEHRLQLQEAAAQARRDRRQVLQRMQELDQQDECTGGVQREPPTGAGSRGDHAVARKAAEDARLLALNEAAAQARRDRKQIQQKMQDLEKPRDDTTRRSYDSELSCKDADGGASRAGGRASRHAAEDQHIKALQDAAAEARRDRKQILQKMQDLERVRSSDSPVNANNDIGNAEKGHEERGGAMSSKAGQKVSEAEHLRALQEAAAESRRDRRQLQQRMQEIEQESPDIDATCRVGRSESSGAPSRANMREANASKAEREAADAKHVQALQEAAAQARRERKQLQQKMHDLDNENLSSDAKSGDVHTEGYRENAPRSQRTRADREAAEAQHAQALQEAALQARRERIELRQKMQDAENEDLISTIHSRGYPAPSEMQGESVATASKPGVHGSNCPSPSLVDPHPSRPSSMCGSGDLRGMLGSGRGPSKDSPQVRSPVLSGSGDQRGLLSSCRLLTGLGSSLENRARSSDVSLDSTRRRPLGRSSSLSLAGSMLARSGSRSRPAVEEVVTSTPKEGSELPESLLSPQFGTREGESAPAAFGGTWSRNKLSESFSSEDKKLPVDIGDVSEPVNAITPGIPSKSVKSATAGDDVQVERIVDGGQPDMCGSTLRLADMSAPEAPAEEQLALKLSRLKSPPPFRMTNAKRETSKASARGSGADSHLGLAIGAEGTMPQVLQLPPSENPTLGSLSYTGTCTLSSQMSTISCIAAK